ncbi:MAG TPA: glycosyltransferase 87 family protein [Acidimicrobiales bacterium]|nr:glycosyltransferase 87 family protein [Acidimicrobiales bacterium]
MADRWRAASFLILALVGLGISLSFIVSPGDTAFYQRYAREALASPFFHSLPKEYPAAALAIFVVPLAFPVPYFVGFALLAGACGLVMTLCSDGLPEFPGWSRRLCIYLLLGVGSVAFGRYDIFPALTALLAVDGARRGKWGRAWAWAVLGGLLKLFPFLLLPGFLIAERRRTGKWALQRLLIAIIPVAVISAAELAVAPSGSLISPLRFEVHRGFELSSLAGTLTFLAGPSHLHWVLAFGAIEVLGRASLAIGVFVGLVAVAGLGAVWLLAWRRRLPVEVVSLAVFSVAVLTDKAFAPQYLIWLIPFWAYWPLRRGWMLAAVLTTAVYPFLYLEASAWGPGYYLATATAAVRNVVLIVATVGWFVGHLREKREVQVDVVEGAFSGDFAAPEPAHALVN